MALRPGTKICKHDDTRGWFSIVGRSKSGMRGNQLQEERRDEDGGGGFFCSAGFGDLDFLPKHWWPVRA